MNRYGLILAALVVLVSGVENAGAGIEVQLGGWWKFDEAGGNLALDSSVIQPMPGILAGDPGRVAGVMGGALDFDGVNDYILLTQPLLPALTMGDFTISMWIQTGDTAGGVLMGSFADGGAFWYFDIIPGGRLRLILAGVICFDDDVNLADGRWHHVAAVRRLGQSLTLYVDGVESCRNAIPNIPYGSAGLTLIGAGIGTNLPYFDGKMDDVRVYLNRALTAEEVAELHDIPPLPSEPQPVDGALLVSVATELGWTRGEGALSHDVYFGTNNPPTTLLADNYAEETIDPGDLDSTTTYYWQVTENTASGPIAGDVWSFTTAWAGSGTEADPYQIDTKEDLLALRDAVDFYGMHFILTADIDLEGQVFTSAVIARDTDSSEIFNGTPFTGVFDGRGHVIQGFSIPSYDNYLGFFGQVYPTGVVKNLGLENATIGTTTAYYAGGLAGKNFGIITHCYASVTVTGYWDVGGLVGTNSGTISHCYATGAVPGGGFSSHLGGLAGTNYGTISQCYATGAVTGSSTVGGLVGENYRGTITQCYATGAVSGNGFIGGLAGRFDQGTIRHCYSTGRVTSSGYAGGLIGTYVSGSITRSYWDKETSEQTDSNYGAIGLSTYQMQRASTYINAGWNFDTVWNMVDGETYPYLQFQGIPEFCGDVAHPIPFGDVNEDCIIDWLDCAILADHWLHDNRPDPQFQGIEVCGDVAHPYPLGDVNEDCISDLLDFAILADRWFEDNRPLDSN